MVHILRTDIELSPRRSNHLVFLQETVIRSVHIFAGLHPLRHFRRRVNLINNTFGECRFCNRAGSIPRKTIFPYRLVARYAIDRIAFMHSVLYFYIRYV